MWASHGNGFQPGWVSGVPFQAAVEDCGLDMKKVLRALPAPSHLLLLAHAPVDELIDRRLHMRS